MYLFSGPMIVVQNMKVDWFYQFKDAIIPSGDKDSDGNDLEPEVGDLLMHVITVFWKVCYTDRRISDHDCIPRYYLATRIAATHYQYVRL